MSNLGLPDLSILNSYGAKAFAMGLLDGRNQNTPKTAEELFAILTENLTLRLDWRRVHHRKLRQVYGAGFDLSKTLRLYG